MSPLLHPLLQSVGLDVPEGLVNGEVEALSCDSRRVGPGTLFVGLPGQSVDGGSFWPAALAAGAVAAVISPAAAALAPPSPADAVLVAPAPLAPLAGRLAAAFWDHPSRQLALIGVTGTNGKTTITHLIEHLAAACGRPSALFGTLVNRWPGHGETASHTTAFADQLQAQLAAAVAAGARVGAMEVSSHALDQGRVAGCDFAGAVFSNLTQDHLDYHLSMEAYFEAKALLFAPPLLAGGEGARAVVNVDDPWGRQLAERLGGLCWRSSLLATESAEAELRVKDLAFGSSGVSGLLITPLGQGRFDSPLLGRFNLMNLLQAVGALLQQGLPLETLLAAIGRFGGVPGRMERVSTRHDATGPGSTGSGTTAAAPTVLVDYAHTPDGLENALKAARPFAAGRLICVFGCGGDRDRGKRPQMGAIAAALADRVVVTSDNPRTEDPQRILDDVVAGIPAGTDLLVEGDRATAIATTVAQANANDLVLIAGKGHEDYQILGTTRIHFDDREQAEMALRSRAASAPA
ncbi:UDP-N-acetylmuramoyl-L-alanyl-D-glutamate--2,6-diaminopimelate ligase [Cyanobium sp. ATX 6F1]|uniref:UDP-N-acetylmuramoyl-L-alanyl-D-glutamate--2, 6-diaminopimelate ligase n=1 Tax=Cyanobium sp. ATX 6F1 TaxID=2823702 RepID=UPI0020CC3984|nr:UDP-N-acetylmuramoyl-L-alanyl-D-glutamate--2,6-diaminopimelate ligase [Cyanobium sp. ATX 6F1]MCP9915089.1 UDP-N-acetylmuramoyl-L-alanyl-D-glutamate--2,6-diaminopimelate ligase [Cyanobium sp. ATX 6F1]